MIWKTFKGLFGKKTEVAPALPASAVDWRKQLYDRQEAQRQIVKARLAVRGKEIARLRRNKKKFSHLLAEQEADKAAIKAGRF